MSSLSSSSSTDSSSSSSSSSSLAKFDPFAVHPFTNCSVTQNGSDPYNNGQASAYGYPYGAPFGTSRKVQSPKQQTQNARK